MVFYRKIKTLNICVFLNNCHLIDCCMLLNHILILNLINKTLYSNSVGGIYLKHLFCLSFLPQLSEWIYFIISMLVFIDGTFLVVVRYQLPI